MRIQRDDNQQSKVIKEGFILQEIFNLFFFFFLFLTLSRSLSGDLDEESVSEPVYIFQSFSTIMTTHFRIMVLYEDHGPVLERIILL